MIRVEEQTFSVIAQAGYEPRPKSGANVGDREGPGRRPNTGAKTSTKIVSQHKEANDKDGENSQEVSQEAG